MVRIRVENRSVRYGFNTAAKLQHLSNATKEWNVGIGNEIFDFRDEFREWLFDNRMS